MVTMANTVMVNMAVIVMVADIHDTAVMVHTDHTEVMVATAMVMATTDMVTILTISKIQ
jgi:hypothetical protein